VTWPIGMGPDFEGVADRRNNTLWKFERTPHGAKVGAEEGIPGAELTERGRVGAIAHGEIELLTEVGATFDNETFMAGASTPVFFGSAMWNFGVRLLLEAIIDMAPSPGARPDRAATPRPVDSPTSGFVFKIQANLDPRHRDRVAYLRICSGTFERGVTLVNRRTGKPFATKYAHQLFGRERDTVDTAFPGDIVGLVNAGDLRIGDSLSADGDVGFPPIPTFAPGHFMEARNLDTSRYKQFRRGMTQLDEEGVIQVLRHPDRGDQQPILAAVGPLQYEVAVHRLENEYGAKVLLSPTPFSVARRTDAAGAQVLAKSRDVDVLSRSDGTLLALFHNQYRLDATVRNHPDVLLDTIVVG
jgi:peptide chain release factor 3